MLLSRLQLLFNRGILNIYLNLFGLVVWAGDPRFAFAFTTGFYWSNIIFIKIDASTFLTSLLYSILCIALSVSLDLVWLRGCLLIPAFLLGLVLELLIATTAASRPNLPCGCRRRPHWTDSIRTGFAKQMLIILKLHLSIRRHLTIDIFWILFNNNIIQKLLVKYIFNVFIFSFHLLKLL